MVPSIPIVSGAPVLAVVSGMAALAAGFGVLMARAEARADQAAAAQPTTRPAEAAATKGRPGRTEPKAA